MRKGRTVLIGIGGFILLAASTLLPSANSEAAPPRPVVQQQADAEVLDLGRGLYTDQCQPCHGDDGKGAGPAARFLSTPPRDLTAGTWAQMKSTTLESMIAATAKGIPDTDMEPFEELLTEEEIFAVAAYVLKAFTEEESR